VTPEFIDRCNADAFGDWHKLLGGKKAMAVLVIGVYQDGGTERAVMYALPSATPESIAALLRESADKIPNLTPKIEVVK
jgi:hypothetical protein